MDIAEFIGLLFSCDQKYQKFGINITKKTCRNAMRRHDLPEENECYHHATSYECYLEIEKEKKTATQQVQIM
ncbi:hypothetical protein AQUCO_10200010v1 [Aquilegia coerulea]|uniref:Uncharacterized protein n=1 Tax=Aquilegia coerulea TaxID=218851 RepID=A0A2G5C3U9_AQUCA|nr:hypothetical protein AQUCO_10200010v1 [Aquilegia coerulea]